MSCSQAPLRASHNRRKTSSFSRRSLGEYESALYNPRVQILLYRSTLDAASGPGQLISHQARALRASGANVAVACERGRGRFFLQTGVWAQKALPTEVPAYQASSGRFVVDHSMKVATADIMFVHNLLTQSNRYLPRNDFVAARMVQEAALFRDLLPATPVVANSKFVKQALIECFGIAPQRLSVVYPGFRSDRFGVAQTMRNRPRARHALGIDDATPLLGFLTPGDFQKRGLDVFLASATEIARAEPDTRFLVIGGAALPRWAQEHPLVATGKVIHRRTTKRPERWLAALDVFLFAAHFEEFGMVVTEALASGVPVLTSRRVGASECLPPEYRPWLLDAPDAASFAELAIALLRDRNERVRLSAAGASCITQLDHEAYARASGAAVVAAHAQSKS
jgi:UDP-glucose:(heptosyl)LPS alpha-1,3-glucosyltransferase